MSDMQRRIKEILKDAYVLKGIDWDSRVIEVLMSGGGYYIGTQDQETGEPESRLSEEYWATHEEAEAALASGEFNLRLSP